MSINIRGLAQYFTVNIMDTWTNFGFQAIQVSPAVQPAPTNMPTNPSEQDEASAPQQLWHNRKGVSGNILERALNNNGFDLSKIFYTKRYGQNVGPKERRS
jgi:hypothetical protein